MCLLCLNLSKVNTYTYMCNHMRTLTRTYTQTHIQGRRHLYGHGEPKASHFLKSLKPACPSTILAPMIPFRVLRLQPVINT